MEKAAPKPRLSFVIVASTLGTAFEGYDFFIFGVLSSILSQHFFSALPASTAFVLTLMTFAVGFVTRPLGAIVFGRFGDKQGRKSAFLATIVLMGLATGMVGVLPTYDQAGVLAPILLVGCRLLQGFALGGEYGGAVIYVAEHSSAASRGMNTAWIQTTGSIGLLAALSVILACRTLIGETAFQAWAWRLPFLLSFVFLIASMLVRAKLHESPVFEAIKRQARTSIAPIKEALFERRNFRSILVVLFGVMAPTGVIFYTGQFYLQFFLERIAKVDQATVNALVLTATIQSAPLFVMFGWLSDKVGRKLPILVGLALILAFAAPAYRLLLSSANPDLVAARERAPIVLHGPQAECGALSFAATRDGKCAAVKAMLADLGAPFSIVAADGPVMVSIGARRIEAVSVNPTLQRDLAAALRSAGYLARADPSEINHAQIVGVLVFFSLCMAAISGPTAAALAELFAPQVRYIAVSVPYHIGLGWFGGFTPAIGFALMQATGDVFAGLWYPLAVTAAGFLVSVLALRESRGRQWFEGSVGSGEGDARPL